MRFVAVGLVLLCSASAIAAEPVSRPTTAPAKPRSIVYTCDASGSMMTKWDAVRSAILAAASKLEPGQTFNVIFFAPETYEALDDKKLLDSTRENLERLKGFLDKMGGRSGAPTPMPGLKRALEFKPDVIYVATDGDFPNNAEVLELFRTENKAKRTRVNTIALFDRDEGYEKFLKQLADENGGTFRVMTDE